MGGYVYRGTQIPSLAGRYLYTDNCAGELRSIQLGIPFAAGDRAESAPGAIGGPQSFGEDASCNVYVTDGSEVDRIVGPPSSARPACPATCVKKKKHKRKKHRAAESKKKHKKHKKSCQKKKHKKKKKKK